MRNKAVIILLSIMMGLSLTACSGNTTTESISLKNEETMEASDEKTMISKEMDDAYKKEITVKDSQDVIIDTEGTYIISGTSKETCIMVDVEDDDEVNIVLAGLSITNENRPCIFVENAGKVNISVNDESNSLSVTGEFVTVDSTETDGVIFSKDDIEIGGTGTLNIMSTANCITSKDSLIINGGEYVVECDGNALEAHDKIEVYEGSIDIERCNDGIHAEDNDDDSAGSVYIVNGDIRINASDDAIHATTTLRIDSGTLKLNAAEGLEATDIQINGGDIDIEASDDGINAANKSSAYKVVFELNDGNVTINMAAGDTDGVDSNGDLYINGGTINITGQSAFDYDGEAVNNGGTIIVNGSQTDTIPNQEFGGMKGGFKRTDMSEDDRMMGPMGVPQGEVPQGEVPQGERPQNKVGGKRQ